MKLSTPSRVAALAAFTIGAFATASCGSPRSESDVDLPDPTISHPVASDVPVITSTTVTTRVTVSTQPSSPTSSTSAVETPAGADTDDDVADAGSTTTLSPTTTVPLETTVPDVETFEPESPQSGFVTDEPQA